jgi:hypothetical protein
LGWGFGLSFMVTFIRFRERVDGVRVQTAVAVAIRRPGSPGGRERMTMTNGMDGRSGQTYVGRGRDITED